MKGVISQTALSAVAAKTVGIASTKALGAKAAGVASAKAAGVLGLKTIALYGLGGFVLGGVIGYAGYHFYKENNKKKCLIKRRNFTNALDIKEI